MIDGDPPESPYSSKEKEAFNKTEGYIRLVRDALNIIPDEERPLHMVTGLIQKRLDSIKNNLPERQVLAEQVEGVFDLLVDREQILRWVHKPFRMREFERHRKAREIGEMHKRAIRLYYGLETNLPAMDIKGVVKNIGTDQISLLRVRNVLTYARRRLKSEIKDRKIHVLEYQS